MGQRADSSDAKGGGLEITGIDAAQAAIASAVEVYRKAGGPVIWVQHSAGSGAPIFNPDNESFDFIGNVRPQGSEKIIIKAAPSSFTGTDLDATLKGLGTKQVVLTGFMAHVCVTGTARSAMEHGYDVVIVKDAIGDRAIPSIDGKSTVTASYLVDAVCTELADAIGTIVNVADIKA